MATLNGLYIFVESEEVSFGIDMTEHTVESGIPITDHIKPRAFTVSLSGEIVGQNAANVIAKIKQMHANGTVCKYSGRNAISNCVILELSTGHPNNVWGGCTFSMTLKQVRTAKTSYKEKKKTKETPKTGTQQVKPKSKVQNVYHTVKKGDTVWALVAATKAPYKKYGLSCNDVMKLNPNAFSRKNDFRTLKIGYKLIVGKR